jgi:hypothetical protein
MRARYSCEIGGEPAGRSSYERQVIATSRVVASSFKLKDAIKHHGQTKSDQTSIWMVTQGSFV